MMINIVFYKNKYNLKTLNKLGTKSIIEKSHHIITPLFSITITNHSANKKVLKEIYKDH